MPFAIHHGIPKYWLSMSNCLFYPELMLAIPQRGKWLRPLLLFFKFYGSVR